VLSDILEKLVEDAELVADVGVRLGRIKDQEFLTALNNARQAVANDVGTAPVVADLQKSLNSAVKDLAPITLYDLRSGWTPFSTPTRRIGTLIFGIFSFVLIVAAAYTTQIYDRARFLYATTVELQDARGGEQAIRLFGLLKRNQQDVIESLISGKKDFLYEAFSKALFDLEVMNLRFQAYSPIATDVLHDLDMWGRFKEVFKSGVDASNPTNNVTIASYLKNYSKSDQPPAKKSLPSPAVDLKNLDIHSLLGVYISNIRAFNSTINVGFDPLAPNDYSYYIAQLRDSMSFLGSWILPALYGMLGAVIFHMRRLLDPTVPNPSWLRFAYRIVLGGFAGIILVWFWTPSSQKLAQPEFATLTSFGLAFLVGFSTDVFFQALDRLVNYLSQAVGQAGA
jgi:hypothetical protein